MEVYVHFLGQMFSYVHHRLGFKLYHNIHYSAKSNNCLRLIKHSAEVCITDWKVETCLCNDTPHHVGLEETGRDSVHIV